MNITQIEKSMPYLLKHKIVPFLWGNQGVGKTQVTKQIASALGYRMICLNLATQDVGDLIGLLKEMPDGSVSHARPSWFPVEGEQKAVVFLDEFNRAHPDVIQAMFPFLQTGSLHKHQLPEDCRIIVAGNYQNDNFSVSEVLSENALMSRFCHIDFRPTVVEFVSYVETLDGGQDISDFINEMPNMLEEQVKDGFNFDTIKPNRRAFADYIRLLELETGPIEDLRYELYQGLIGTSCAATFQTWKTKRGDALRARDVINKYDSVRGKVLKLSDSKNSRFDILNGAVEEMMLYLEKNVLKDNQLKNLQQFLLDIPLELSSSVFNKIEKSNWKQKHDVLNNKEFVSRFVSIKKGKNDKA